MTTTKKRVLLMDEDPLRLYRIHDVLVAEIPEIALTLASDVAIARRSDSGKFDLIICNQKFRDEIKRPEFVMYHDEPDVTRIPGAVRTFLGLDL